MTTRTQRVGLAVGVGALLVGAAATGAAAQEQTEVTAPAVVFDLDEARVRCIEGLDRRYKAIDELNARMDRSQQLTDDHEATLEAELGGVTTGLQGIEADLNAATTVDEIKTACSSMVFDYRVFVLRVHEVAAGDTLVGGAARLDEASVSLQAAIDAAAAGGFDVSAEQGWLDDMIGLIGAAEATGLAVPSNVIGLTVADINEGDGIATLEANRDDLKEARHQLGDAADLAHMIVDSLENLDGQ